MVCFSNSSSIYCHLTLLPNMTNCFKLIIHDPYTTTTWGYFAIQISSQTTKKEISKSPLLQTIIPRKLLTFCDTITFTTIPSQVLHNS
jgi:hypothetical protein